MHWIDCLLHEVKKNMLVTDVFKLRSIPLLVFLLMNILIDNLLMQFFSIQNRKMCSSKNILYQYFVVTFPLPGTKSILYIIK